MSHDNTYGEIKIAPINRMTATYTIYGIENTDALTEITSRVAKKSEKNTEISIRAIGESIKNMEIDIKYRGNSEVFVEIQPIGHVNVPVEIYVRPQNRMWALYEVQEPPQITDVLNPMKDAFTREKEQYQSINYGANNSLTVGRLSDEVYRSFIQFYFGDWNPQFVIIESKLRLYYSGTIPDGTNIELFTVREQWTEHGVTHLNRPSPSSFIVDKYTNNVAERYVEFEFTGIVEDWIKQHTDNQGFIVRLANESVETIVTFRARESSRPPELFITYYDSRIYSGGRTQVPVEIFVWNVGNEETLVEITVGSVIKDSDTLTEIYIHRYEVPIDSECDVEITVTKPVVYAEIEVWRVGESARLVELTVRSDFENNKRDVEITVSKPNVNTQIIVKHVVNVDAEILVRRLEDSSLLTTLAVTREAVDTEIYIKFKDSIDTVITVQKEIESIIYSTISATRRSVLTEITSKVKRNKDKDTELYVRAVDKSVKLTEIAVSRESVLTEITVSKFFDVDTEIYVKHTDDKLTEITVTVFDDVMTEIDIVAVSKILAEITTSKPETWAEIMVPYWDDSDTLVIIEPRIGRVSDKLVEIFVRSKGGAYAFII